MKEIYHNSFLKLSGFWLAASILLLCGIFKSDRLFAQTVAPDGFIGALGTRGIIPIGIGDNSIVEITHIPFDGSPLFTPDKVFATPFSDPPLAPGVVIPIMPLHRDEDRFGNFSDAMGATMPIVNLDIFGLQVISPAGVGEFDPLPLAPGVSELIISFNIDFFFGEFNFPLPWFAVGNFPMVSFADSGDIVNFSVVGDFFEILVDLNGQEIVGPSLLNQPITLGLVNDGLGLVEQNLEFTEQAIRDIPAGSRIRFIGTVNFRADNHSNGAFICLGSTPCTLPGPSAIPEPGMFTLLAAALAALGLFRLSPRLTHLCS